MIDPGLLRIVLAATALVALAAWVLPTIERGMLYFPRRGTLENFQREAAEAGWQPWVLDDTVVGWRREGSDRSLRIVILHGNGGAATDRIVLADRIRLAGGPLAKASFAVLEYPGYGHRTGTPSEKSLVADAVAALKSLPDPVVLVGESLGSGVAAQVASRIPEQISRLVLLTPFDSLVSAAKVHYPLLPAGLLLRDRYDSVRALENFNQPVTVIIGGDDVVLPPTLGRRLYDSLRAPKHLIESPGSGHNETAFNLNNADWQRALGVAP